MSNYFVDSSTGNDANSGVDTDNAWATIENAVEAGSLVPGDIVWVRPSHSEAPSSIIYPAYSGNKDSGPVSVVAWPKAEESITSADWTNGSTTVDNVVGVSLTKSGHVGRLIVGPDGITYFITYITDSNTFTIDREYGGTTVTGASGASTIQADDLYTEAQAIDDSSWTIKLSAWDANNPARPVIDFSGATYYFYMYNKSANKYQGLHFNNGGNAVGVFYSAYNDWITLKGTLFTQTDGAPIINNTAGTLYIEELIIEGDGTSGQHGLTLGRNYSGGGAMRVINAAIYSCQIGIFNSRPLYLENVNIGIEGANTTYDIYNVSQMEARDLRLDGTNGLVNNILTRGGGAWAFLAIENYQKIFGNHRTFLPIGYYERVAVSGETPNKKLSDYVLKLTPDKNGVAASEFATAVIDHTLKVDTSSLTLRYWIYNDSGVTLNSSSAKDDIWLEVEYVSDYDSSTHYAYTKEVSTETNIADAADADDWDYIEVTIQAAVESVARVRVFFNEYLAATNVFIDPNLVIS